MANTTLKTRILLNNKTAAEWAKDTETVWLKGEFLVESDTKKCKIGDGVKKYNELTYAYLTPEEVNSIVAQSSHTHSNKAILDATTASFTTALLQKLNAIAAGAEVNVQSDWNITDSSSDAFIKNKPTSMPASDVSAWAKAPTKPKYTATEVGADPTGSSAKALTDAKAYADQKIADLVNDAPETMDTLKEVSDALDANKNVVDALNSAIGKKANQADLTTHTGNADIHVTKEKKTAWDGAATHAGSAHAPVNSERNTIISIKKNGSAVPINEDRSVDISVPTKVSQLANDAGYKTTDNNTTYSLGVAANSSANGTAKIRLTGSDTKTTDIAIKGAGSTSVTTDAEGNLIVTSADTKYTHPTGDGNLHVPATGTTNNGKVLKAGATAGSAAWAQLTKADVGLGNVDNTSDATKSVASAAKLATARNINVGGAVTATAASFNGSADATINVTSLNAAKLVLNSGDVLILDGSI